MLLVTTKDCNVVMNVSVREFKARLSRYIRAAHSGKDVVITSRGKAVARIVPVPSNGAIKPGSREQLLRKLELLVPGVRIGRRKFELPKNTIKVRPGEKTLAEIVAEGRR